jgi:hypothetical protein
MFHKVVVLENFLAGLSNKQVKSLIVFFLQQ